MSLLLELPPQTESALAAKAARLGIPLERYAAGVLRRDVEASRDTRIPDRARKERRARRLAALEAAIETARGFESSSGVLAAPLSDFALSRAGAYDAE